MRETGASGMTLKRRLPIFEDPRTHLAEETGFIDEYKSSKKQDKTSQN